MLVRRDAVQEGGQEDVGRKEKRRHSAGLAMRALPQGLHFLQARVRCWRDDAVRRLLLGFLFVGSAHAQTGSMSIDSARSPLAAGRVTGFSVQALKADPLTGLMSPISGQTVALGAFDLLNESVLAVDFKGLKTAPMTVAALRLVISGSGTGWKIPDTHPAWVDVPVTTVVVPAGKGIGYRYDMPALGMGTLQWAVGALAATIPPPVGGGPVVTGTVTPVVVSKPGDSVPPLAELTTMDLAKWTLAGGAVFRNGVNTNVLFSATMIYISTSGALRAFNSNSGYICWSGTAWVGGAC